MERHLKRLDSKRKVDMPNCARTTFEGSKCHCGISPFARTLSWKMFRVESFQH
ncbi:hypothetical protein DPMN_109789 [Dreissena polymorpha]|uniref:Uncharacterized protein n=1 Tax=Dreissena polymorpha TaxID=45954 RepID=A0A9D4KBL7_DREPO|nr:hypothetical protein DPMN_109789 [Dreissena polymorpha]